MKKKEEPAKLFERIKAVEVKYNTKTRKISKIDKIAIVISQAPCIYRSIITTEQRAQKSNLKLTDLQDVMNQYYHVISRDMDFDSDNDEIILSIFNYNCHKFRKKGHMAKDYRVKDNNRKKFSSTCNRYGKYEHKFKDYWLSESNADRRPRNQREGARNLEITAIHDNNPPEIILSTIDVENKYNESKANEMPSLYEDRYVTYLSDETVRELLTLMEREYETESSDEDNKEAYPAETNRIEYNLNLEWKQDEEYKIHNDSYNCNILPLSLPSYDNDNSTIEPNVKNAVHHELDEQKLNSDVEVGD